MSNNNIKSVETKKIDVRFRGNQVVQDKYKRREGYTRKQIVEFTQAYSDKLKNKGFDGMVAVSIKYPEDEGGQWRGGYARKVGTPVLIYSHHDSDINMEEPEAFPEFRIYTIKNGSKVGKSHKNNDCLFYAIKNVLHNEFIFKKPEELKEFLHTNREDGVDIDKIPQLEKHLGIRINVSGDHLYTSTLTGHREINLTLIDGHYDVDKGKTYTTRGIAKTEKKPLIVSIDNEVYNGKKKWTITKEELSEIRKYPNKAKYVIVARAADDNTSLEDLYHKFIKDANILKAETLNVINMYKTGSDTKTASYFFEYFSRSYHTDEIAQNEAEYINKASIGALIFAEPYEGPLYEYDVCSMYPSIMTDNHMLFPLKRGTWLKYTQEEFEARKFYVYGIYRCTIYKSKDHKIDRLFRFNRDCHYTHFDLNTAKHLGLKIEMIEDDQPNVLYYSRDCLINGNSLFYKFVQMLFKLKERKIAPKRVKSILNCLWGYLTRANVIDRIIKNQGEIVDVDKRDSIHMICPTSKNGIRLQTVPNDKMFETNYARIKPFLLAKGRKMIAELIEPHNKYCVRTHTDSILSKKPIEFEPTKYKLGSMVLKQSSNHAKVHNNVYVEWGKNN